MNTERVKVTLRLKKIERVDANGFKEIYHVDEQRRIQGKYIKYKPDGSKLYECNYKDDKRHGKYIEYYPDGTKKECKIYQDGIISKHPRYNEKGQKVEERKYFYPEEI